MSKKKKLNRLKIVLAEKDLTNRWLAGEMDVSELTVSRWVTNSRQPNLATLFEIAETLKVDVCDLINRDSQTHLG
ncbi:MAG: helix-turn-helix transcriptional regulator [Bacteroidota bacterium]